MFTVMSQFIGSVLLSAATLTNPTTPKTLSFDASAFVTVNNQIRVAVSKTDDISVAVILRDNHDNVLYQRTISKKEHQVAMRLTVDELADGQYELEVRSNEGSIRKQLTLATKPVQTPSRVIAMQ